MSLVAALLFSQACSRPEAPAPGVDPKPAAVVDTGWWAPLPTAVCPDPPDDAFVVEPVAISVTLEWWDSNLVTYPNYLFVRFSASNYGQPPCDTNLAGFWDESNPGRASVTGFLDFTFDRLDQFIGVHDFPRPEGAELDIFGTSVWFDVIGPDGIERSAWAYDQYHNPLEGTATLCISTLTPDVFGGAFTYTGPDGQTWHVPILAASRGSKWFLEHDTVPPCMTTLTYGFRDLMWSGVWP